MSFTLSLFPLGTRTPVYALRDKSLYLWYLIKNYSDMFIQIFTSIDAYILVAVSEISTIEKKGNYALVTLKDGRVLETMEQYDVLIGNLNALLPQPIDLKISPED